MKSHLQELLEREAQTTRIIRLLNIANLQSDTAQAFAEKCLSAGPCSFSEKECIDVFSSNGEAFFRFVCKYIEPSSFPLEKEYMQVTLVRFAQKIALENLKPKLREAMLADQIRARLQENNPIAVMNEWLNQEYDHGNASRQKDLKPVIRILKESSHFILTGIGLLADKVGFDELSYADLIASAFCNPTKIPQKGLRFAATILARSGGSELPFEIAFERNLRIYLCGKAIKGDADGAATSGRLSETKTVLSSLKLAKVEKGRHNERPSFNDDARDFLLSLL